eukprot:2473635-Pleurochrysis_carterae.AAC.1
MARVSALTSERAAFFGSYMPTTESSACVKCRLVLKDGGCVDAKGQHPVAPWPGRRGGPYRAQ